MRTDFFPKKLRRIKKKDWTKNCPSITSCEIIMPFLLSVRERLVLPAIFLAFPLFVSAQNVAMPQGNEYAITGALVGDQGHSSIALNQNGGYLVWEDNAVDKVGSGIGCVRLNSAFTKLSSFTVNKIAKGDQRKPQVQLLANGDAIFVWQGNGLGTADIYVRILKSDGTFLTSDVRINSYIKDQQSEPVVAALPDGGALVAWQSYGQDGSMMGIYARKISATGSMAPMEFQVNQAVAFNQRTPAIATLKNGNVVITWISEQERFMSSTASVGSVDVYARLFDASANAFSDEILVNSGNNICANPSMAPLSNGGFTVAWSEKDSQNRSNSWEIVGRSFSADGVAAGADFKINTNTYGDQYRPRIATIGNDCVVVWTSLGQDGSWEGVFGRLLQGGTEPSGSEFRANNTVVSRQIYPAIGANGAGQFLVSWSSFMAVTGFDLFGRKYTLTPVTIIP